MNWRTIAIGAAALTALVVLGAWALSEDDSAQPDAVAEVTSAPATSVADATTLVPATSAPTTVALAAAACSSTEEPHLFARGVITSIDGVSIAVQGETAGLWFSMGNSVSFTVPEAGGSAVVTMVAALASDAGAFQTYQVGHDSRGAYPPPDPRTPENYLGFDATTDIVAGTVGLSIEALRAGELPAITPAEFTQSDLTASFDAANGTITGTLVHPDLSIEFVADEVTTKLAAVYSSPECFLEAMEAVRNADNPAP